LELSVDASPYAAIAIGSGQDGHPFRIALAKAGMRIALFDWKHFGGTSLTRLISSAAKPITSA
jgi:pyruvate/2-oxoglutarate dehydrogenase complex dihydrolipoamide dehydrogenase (E3) component